MKPQGGFWAKLCNIHAEHFQLGKGGKRGGIIGPDKATKLYPGNLVLTDGEILGFACLGERKCAFLAV